MMPMPRCLNQDNFWIAIEKQGFIPLVRSFWWALRSYKALRSPISHSCCCSALFLWCYYSSKTMDPQADVWVKETVQQFVQGCKTEAQKGMATGRLVRFGRLGRSWLDHGWWKPWGIKGTDGMQTVWHIYIEERHFCFCLYTVVVICRWTSHLCLTSLHCLEGLFPAHCYAGTGQNQVVPTYHEWRATRKAENPKHTISEVPSSTLGPGGVLGWFRAGGWGCGVEGVSLRLGFPSSSQDSYTLREVRIPSVGPCISADALA